MQKSRIRIDEFISKVYCSRDEAVEATIKATSQKDRWNRMEKQLNGGKRLVSIFRDGTLQRDRVQPPLRAHSNEPTCIGIFQEPAIPFIFNAM